MSSASHPPEEDEDPTPGPGEEGFLEAHREQLEREAASDAPAAWVCQDLLESLDDEEGES